MAQVEKPLQEPPQDSSQKESLDAYLEDMRRKVNSQSVLVADATGSGDIVAQFNALLVALKNAGLMARS